MNSFLKQTAESIVRQIGWTELSKATLVLPTHRAGITLKDEILQIQQTENQRAIYAPRVTTISQLFDELSPLYAEDELMTIVRLYRLYAKLNPMDLMPLDMFYGWGRQMLADFTNVDASMPAEEVPNFFDNAIAATELEQLQIDADVRERLQQLFNGKEYNDPESVREQYKSIWANLYELYKALHAEMQAEQKGYPGMRQRNVIEQWDADSVQAHIAGRTFVFVGFNYLLPVERELMEHLRDARQALFYWDYVADFQTNEKAFSFAVQNSLLLGTNTQPQQWSAPKEIDIYSCSSREVQAQYVHQWLLDNYTREGERVGVVICDESMLEPVIYTLPAITLPGKQEPTLINITKGFPLRNTQIFAEVMHWLSNRENGKADDIVSPEFIDKLSAYLFPETTPTTQTAETTSAGLEWQELLQLESSYQVRKILNQMRKLITDGLGDIPYTLKLVRLLMRRMMENVTMPFHGEPISDIQVLGVLETRMLDFDKLLLLNVEEGVVPQTQADFSFIPYYLRKYYHMQTNDERATVYAYNFFRLLSRAGHTTMLFANIGGADNSKGMSRFVMQILTSPEFKANKLSLNESTAINRKSLIDEEKQSLIEAKGLANIKLSPSALNSYITCPYKFYLEKIRGIKEPEKEENEMPANVLGSLVHNTMQAIYQELGCDNKEPVEILAEKLSPYKEDTKLQEMLAKAYDELNRDQQKYHRTKMYVLENQFMDNPKIIQYVKNLIDNDLRTIETEGLKIWKLEQDFYMKLPVPEIGDIQFGGRIDRVDICGHKTGNERIRIVDYKTGSFKSDKLSVKADEVMTNAKKGYVRQTIIYSHVLMSTLDDSKPIQPNLFFCTGDMTGLQTVVKVDESVNDYRTIQESVFPKLQDKVRELLQDAEFPQCAEGECDSYCAFYDLCKRKKKEF